MSNEVPEFWRWQRYLLRTWKPKGNQDHLIAFALRMATYANDDGEMFVSSWTLAADSGLTVAAARQRRNRCVRAGILRDTGRRKAGERVLVRSLPRSVTVTGGHASVTGGPVIRSDNEVEVNRSVTGGHASQETEPALFAPVVSAEGLRPSSSPAFLPPMEVSEANVEETPRGVTGGHASGTVGLTTSPVHDDVADERDCRACRDALSRLDQLGLSVGEIRGFHAQRRFPDAEYLARSQREAPKPRADPESVLREAGLIA